MKKYHFFESAAVLLSRYSPLFYLIWTLNSLHIIEWVQSMEPISGSEFDHARVTLWNSWLIRFWMCNWRNDRRSHDDDHHLSRKSHLKWKIRFICMYLLLPPHSQGAILSKIHSLIKYVLKKTFLWYFFKLTKLRKLLILKIKTALL